MYNYIDKIYKTLSTESDSLGFNALFLNEEQDHEHIFILNSLLY